MGKDFVDRELEAAMCPGSKEGQEHPGLCDQEIKDMDYPDYCALVLVPQHRKDVCKPEQV